MTQEQLSGAEIDTLYKLGREYPHGVEAGDIPSKVGRSELIRKGWARYETFDGSTYLTAEGYVVYRARKTKAALAQKSAEGREE